jgi:hypothetical protein
MACSTNEKRNPYRILAGNPERTSPLGRPRSRWVDNIKMDLREIGWGGVNCIDLARDRSQWRAFAITVMNLRVLENIDKFLSTWLTGGSMKLFSYYNENFHIIRHRESPDGKVQRNVSAC